MEDHSVVQIGLDGPIDFLLFPGSRKYWMDEFFHQPFMDHIPPGYDNPIKVDGISNLQ
jgi:hypothetical protein